LPTGRINRHLRRRTSRSHGRLLRSTTRCIRNLRRRPRSRTSRQGTKHRMYPNRFLQGRRRRSDSQLKRR
ncbi:hypothetical protein H0H93_002647, partial [Arthromyces matolae]